MNYIFAVLISLHCALRVSANPIQPTVTPPALRPRQQDVDLENDERFLAYWYYPTSGTSYLTPALCNIDEFFTTSATIGTTYAACCSRYTFSGGSTWDCSAQITTACSDGTIAFYSDTSTTCASTYTCNTFTVYRSSTNDAFGMPYVACSFSERSEMWREFPAFAEASLSAEPEPPSTSTSVSQSSASPASGAKTPSSTPVQTSAPFATLPPAEPAQSKESSKAWVAGVAVGGVALIAIAALVLWLLRMRRRNAQPYAQAPQMRQHYPSQQPMAFYAGPPSAISPHDEAPKEPYPAPGELPSHVVANYATELPELVTPTRR